MTEPSAGPRPDDTRAEVLTIVRSMAPEPGGDLTGATRLIDDLGYQSLRLVELTMVLEETFGLPPFDRTELAGVLSVGDVVALIERHTARQGNEPDGGADS